MKKNCISIPLDNSSNYNSRYPRDSNKTLSNCSGNNRISYENIASNIYVQNEYNPFKKSSNEFITLNTRELYPSKNAQVYRSNYYDRQNYNNDRYSDSNYNKEYLQTSINKQHINEKKIFNGNQNTKWIVNNYYDNNNDMEKNRENYTYYESKYSRKTNNKNNYLKNNKVNEQNINYNNENYNYSNISFNKKPLKKSHYDSNTNINNKIVEDSEFKRSHRVIPSKIENEKLNIRSNSKNRNNINDKTNNHYNYPSSSSVHLDIYKDNYHSPEKNGKIGTNIYDLRDNSRIGKKMSSQSSDKIPINKEVNIKSKNENKNKNKKIEIIKMYKSNMIGLKKMTNSALKKIPFSPRKKNMKSSINESSINVNKEKRHTIKNNYSYSEIKPRGSRGIFQSDYSEMKEKKNFSVIKGLKLINNKNFKKSISSEIDKSFNYKKFERANSLNHNPTKLSTIQLGSKLLDNDDNNKMVNISYNNHSKYTDNEETTDKRHNLFLSKLKKGRSGAINDNKSDGKLLRRLYSHQKLNINPEFNRENLKTESSKIINTIINNLTKSNILENSQRHTNDSILNKKNKYDNYTNNNTLNKYNKYNINTEIKKSIKSKGSNIIHTITSNKIKTPKLENNYHSKLNLKITHLSRDIKTPMKRLSQTKTYLKINENDEEENWDDNEFLGLGKKTYDIGQRQIKNKIKKHMPNLMKKTFMPSEKYAQPSFIKYFESLSIPGTNDNGNKKINQDSYIMERNINGILNFNIFGVLDGHGENGHYASQFVSRYIMNYIKNNPLIKKCGNAKEVYETLKYNGYEIIANLYMDADAQIAKEKFDCKNSGTTCVIVIQLEEKIICSNAGDSRAIMILDKIKNDNLNNSKIYPLSYDCKPDLPNEKKRIHENGGIVRKSFDDYDDDGPFRVFEKEEEYPGLAMSRSIGDIDAKKLGVIPNPQIVEYKIDCDTKYMLICSDGIWEFISNEDAMKIGNKFYLKNDAKGLCQELYKKSLDFWLQEDVVVDDITVIAVFF